MNTPATDGLDGADGPATRWETEAGSAAYAERFARLAAAGEDLDGEARFIDALAPRGATVLDAGCGIGRTTAALTRRGHHVVGVDRDRALVDVAVARHPEARYAVHDLLTLTPAALAAAGHPAAYDVVVLAGNVLVFVAPGTERDVLARMRDLLVSGGRAVAGFATDRDYTVAGLDRDAQAVGLVVEQRFATWHLDAWSADAGWAVTVLRRP